MQIPTQDGTFGDFQFDSTADVSEIPYVDSIARIAIQGV